jgi:hypothetical protein
MLTPITSLAKLTRIEVNDENVINIFKDLYGSPNDKDYFSPITVAEDLFLMQKQDGILNIPLYYADLDKDDVLYIPAFYFRQEPEGSNLKKVLSKTNSRVLKILYQTLFPDRDEKVNK